MMRCLRLLCFFAFISLLLCSCEPAVQTPTPDLPELSAQAAISLVRGRIELLPPAAVWAAATDKAFRAEYKGQHVWVVTADLLMGPIATWEVYERTQRAIPINEAARLLE